MAFIAHTWLTAYTIERSHGNASPYSVGGKLGGGATLSPGDTNTTTASSDASTLAALTPEEMQRYRNDSAEMFQFSFQNYMQNAFPRDDLRPISCRGSNSQGGIALSLLDSLDALVIFDDLPAFKEAVQFVVDQRINLFNVDARVHVFEVTIRALGGLLSAHSLLALDPRLAPDYDGHSLLTAAVDLADRLIPAFDTPTGLPLSWVNLKRGRVVGDTRITCTACAGTLLLEFGVLSRLSGNKTYEAKARRAVEYLWSKRSARGLVGNTINVDTGRWLRRDAGIGAGVDSFYEYLLKSYLAFGEPVYLDMFAESYAAAQAHLALSSSINGVEWLVTVHMATGRLMNHFISSLAAFWPGMQALAGQVHDGIALHTNWTAAWERFGWLPESFSINLQHSHPTMTNYPLRPELIESTYLLHATTGKDELLHSSVRVLERLRDHTRVKCGHASVGDIGTSRLEDTMESFFLSETLKYLYLTFANATTLIDHYVLSTEGHLFPPFEASEEETARRIAGDRAQREEEKEERVEQQERSSSTSWFARILRGNKAPFTLGVKKEDTACIEVCDNLSEYYFTAAAAEAMAEVRAEGNLANSSTAIRTLSRGEVSSAALRAALPRIPAFASTAALLRQRRCTACKAVSSAVTKAKKKADDLWRTNADSSHRAGRTHVAPPQWARSRIAANAPPQKLVLCVLGEAAPSKLHCTFAKEILSTDLTSQAVQSVVQNAVFFQIGGTLGGVTAEVLAPSLSEVQILQLSGTANETKTVVELKSGGNSDTVFVVENAVPAMLAEFGPDFLPGCNTTDPAVIAVCQKEWDAVVAEQKSFAYVDNEEPTEEGETEEAVLQRIAAVENAAGGGSAGEKSRLESGSDDNNTNSSGGEVEQDDDDPYIDPDELEAAEIEKKRKLKEKSCAAGDESDSESCSADQQNEKEPPVDLSGDIQFISMESFEAVDATGAAAQAMQAANTANPNAGVNGEHAVCQALGRLVPTTPFDGCTHITNTDAVRGNIALIQRGNCSFQSKVVAAEVAGAVGVVVLNADGEGIDGRTLMTMAPDASDGTSPLPMPRIPSVMVRAEDGLALMAAAEQGQWGRMWDPHYERKLEMGSVLVEEAKREDEKHKKLQAAAAAVAKAAAEKLKKQQGSAPENAAADTEAAAAALEAASMSNILLDVVVPPNSHPWVMHALYTQKQDMVMAFQTAAKILAPSVVGVAQNSK